MESWEQLLYELDDADLITDEKMGELITWHGGLNRLVAHGLQSCQAFDSDIVPFGTKAVILLSSALFGPVLTKLESLLKEQLWSSILIITATSGASHLILHGAEADFTFDEVFEQFKARATTWCGDEVKLRALGAPNLSCFEFGAFGPNEDETFTVVAKPITRLYPLRLSSMEQGASFFKLEKHEQTNLADLAESFRQHCLGDMNQADLWSCGEMAHMVAMRVNKYNGSSSQKSAVLIFDRSVQLAPQIDQNNALDLMLYALSVRHSVNVSDATFLDKLPVELANPGSADEASLLRICRTRDLSYASVYAKKRLADILLDEKIKLYEEDGLDVMLDHVKQNTRLLVHHTGLIAICHLLHQTEQKMEQLELYESLSLLRLALDAEHVSTEQFLFLLLRIMYNEAEIDPDELQMAISAFCLRLFNDKSDVTPFDIEPESNLEDIIDIVTPRIEYAYANVVKLRDEYAGLDYVTIIENLFIPGLPMPGFIRHHTGSLMGKLTSGFGGLFGAKTETSKELRDYDQITLFFAGGLTLSEVGQIEQLGMKLGERGKKLKIVTGGFYHKKETVQWF